MVDREKITAFDTRRYPIRPHVGVGILLVRDKHLLLIKRKYNPDAGYWSIPGGHLDLGEEVEKAAEREGFEEIMRGKALNDRKYQGNYVSPACTFYEKY